MARNRVQFQKELSEARFDELYGSEDRCREVVFRWRWPQGFVCPGCGGRNHCVIKTRALYQCTSCRRQTSLMAGTIFASTKVPLRTWFRTMYHLTQSKGGISSLELGRRLGVTQTTAWKLKHKLMQVMMERDAGKRLTGRVEMDDAYLGGERSGGKRGRGAPGKTPIIVAIETTPEGKPVRLKLRRVIGFRRKEVWRITHFLRHAGQVLADDPILEPVRKALTSFEKHLERILQRWSSSHSNARLEGLNGLFQAARARARGYRNTTTFATMIYLIAAPLEDLFQST